MPGGTDRTKQIDALLREPKLREAIRSALARRGLEENAGAADIKDGTQNALVALWAAWDKDGVPETLEAAIAMARKVAGRRAIDLGRKGGAAKSKLTASADIDDVVKDVGDPAMDPLDAKNALAAVQEILASEKFKDSDVAILQNRAKGGTHAEHAAETQTPLPNIRQRYARATATLATQLAARGFGNIGIAKVAAAAIMLTAIVSGGAAAVGIGYVVYRLVIQPAPVESMRAAPIASATASPAPSASTALEPSPPGLRDNLDGPGERELFKKASLLASQKKWNECAEAFRDGYVPDSGELPRLLRELFNRCVQEAGADLNSKGGPTPTKKKPTPPKTDAATP